MDILVWIVCLSLLPTILIATYKGFNNATIKNRAQLLKRIANENSIQMPYLSDAFSDYILLLDMEISDHLKYKKHPALKASQNVATIAREKKQVEKQLKMLKYQLSIYEKVAPWLEDFKEVTVDDIKEVISTTNNDNYENIKKWLSPTEYKKLSTTKKYQLALERYKSSPKTNWQIGIDFERYVGYLYESNGYKVDYYGANEGLSDLGRDVIARKVNETIVIQCKYWRKKRIVHEKHIFQLYGTMFAEQIDKPNQKISGVFVTTTSLSETAKKYANKLNIKIDENAVFDKNYPCVKCNISKKNGEKIYHLPFDQQYDKILIEPSRGECYVNTVYEAEKKGFRRAFKWVAKK